jgi:hypothetical protein
MEQSIMINLSLTIFAILSVVAIIRIVNKNKEKRTKSALNFFANENNSKISNYDNWNKTLIGIDDIENFLLFFIRSASGIETRQIIRLSEVKDCRILKTSRNEKYHDESVNVTDQIQLVFSFHNKQKQDVSLEFYNTEYDRLNLTGELQLAEKWMNFVRSILSKNPQWKKEAGTLKHNFEAFKRSNTQTHVSQSAKGKSKRTKKNANAF